MSRGITLARAFWLRAPGEGEIRTVDLPAPGPDDVVVRTRFSAVSRGTETLVFRGGVPASQHARMRAPFQVGDFPAPVEYGYLNVGEVEDGPGGAGRADRVLPRPAPDPLRRPGRRRDPGARTPCRRPAPCWPAPSRPRSTPCGTPRRWSATGSRSSAAGWSAAASPRLLARLPGVRVQLVDVDPARAGVAAALGVGFAAPADAAGDCDLVVHASATDAGLARVAGAARRRGRGDRAELVRRPPRHAAARRGLPLAAPDDPREPGRHGRPGPARAPRRTPTAWRSRCACSPTRCSTR